MPPPHQYYQQPHSEIPACIKQLDYELEISIASPSLLLRVEIESE